MNDDYRSPLHSGEAWSIWPEVFRLNEHEIFVTDLDVGLITNLFWPALLNEKHVNIRWVRGRKMRSDDEVMTEMSASFQFPLYFGNNWAALQDCLGDATWLDQSDHTIIMIITDASEVLADSPEVDKLTYLIEVVQRIIRRFESEGCPSRFGTSLPIPFHLVLQDADIGRLKSTLSSAKLDHAELHLS
ncbi:MAG: barstar family protein [Dehalococcoidia bacterium]|nr:barstar family protein [Dehalococcoidia bacterium]